jgi:hypothetical protein
MMLHDTPSRRPVIAILGGTGKEGSGLALRWACAGYPILIGSRQEEKARSIARQLNAELDSNTIQGAENSLAARQADICVLTVAHTAHMAAIEALKGCLSGKILVDATARVDFRNPLPPLPPSAARLAQQALGSEARVVAAFQNVPAHSLRVNLGGSLDADVLVCADDLPAAEEVIELAQAGGMRAYYAGNLDQAIVLEGLTSILINLNRHYHVKTASIAIGGISLD